MFTRRSSIGLLVVFLFIFRFPVAMAQNDAGQPAPVIPQTNNTAPNPKDTNRINQLMALSGKYLYNNADSALYYANQALQSARKQQNTIKIAEALNNLASALYVCGYYERSQAVSSELMETSRKINYQTGLGNASLISGLIYMSQNKYDDAASNFKNALGIFSATKDYKRAGKGYFDLGICSDESGKHREAFPYLEKALQLAHQVNDSTLVVMVLNRTGETWLHLNNYSKAATFYRQVINTANAPKWELDFAYSGLAKTSLATGQYQNAITYALKSYSYAKAVGSQFDKAQALDILSKSYAAAGDYKNAYNYHVTFKHINDSLFNTQEEKEVNSMHLKQQLAANQQLEREIKRKEESISVTNRLLLFRNMIGIVVVFIVAMIIINNRQKSALNRLLQKQNTDIAKQKEEILKQKNELGTLNQTKDQLFSVISHDLRSPFAAILQSLAILRTGDIPEADRTKMMDEFYRQVSLVNNMVNNLLAWANSQRSGIKSNPVDMDITAAVSEIVSVSEYLAQNKDITVKHCTEQRRHAFADADHVKIIVQNLLGNAIKFTPSGGNVNIFYSEDEKYLAIHVRDSGVGIHPEKLAKIFKVSGKEISSYGTGNETGSGLGLALVKQFAEAGRGRLEVKSKPGEGAEFIVHLPKTA